MKMLPKLLLSLIASALSTAAFAVPLLVLPTTAIDGIGPQQYDNATVYSLSLLAQQQAAGLLPGNTSDFSFAAGSGNLGIIVYSANGVQNPVGFDTPMQAGNATFDGTWGVGVNGTIGLLRNYLTVGGVAWQPLFIFDHNENKPNPNLLVQGSVQVMRGTTVLATYKLDDNGGYVLSCGSVAIGPAAPNSPPCSLPLPTPSSTTYTWTTNGSGAPDYVGAMATFDLYSSAFLATDSIVVSMSLKDEDGGFEELSIGGYQFAAPSTHIPEPGSLALFAGSLLMLGAVARRRAAKK